MKRGTVVTMMVISAAVLTATAALVFTGVLPESMRDALDVWLEWGLLLLSIAAGLWRLRREPRSGRWIQLAPLVLGCGFLALSISCAVYFDRAFRDLLFWS